VARWANTRVSAGRGPGCYWPLIIRARNLSECNQPLRATEPRIVPVPSTARLSHEAADALGQALAYGGRRANAHARH
jgi:hypothetical protein